MHTARSLSAARTLLAALALAALACSDAPGPAAPNAARTAGLSAPAPSPLVTVAYDGTSLEFWPYTGSDFSGSTVDPVNLVFFGSADPRALRAALLMLDGDRSAYGIPNAFPFNCTWQDVPEGGVQTTYGAGAWTGSVIQLACGDFGPMRFHLRLFGFGGATLGAAHFELQIPGTTDHQVLSWELSQGLVTVDFVRSGLLGAAPAPTGIINAQPTYREIPAQIYALLPDELKALIGGPQIPNDGSASLLVLAGSEDGLPLVARKTFVVNFDQVIPKPFCASGPYDYLAVQGPVTLTQQVVFTPSGNYLSYFQALGTLSLTPLNPPGETYRAQVVEHHRGVLTDKISLAASFQMQLEVPQQGPFRGRLAVRLTVGPAGVTIADVSVRCTS